MKTLAHKIRSEMVKAIKTVSSRNRRIDFTICSNPGMENGGAAVQIVVVAPKPLPLEATEEERFRRHVQAYMAFTLLEERLGSSRVILHVRRHQWQRGPGGKLRKLG